MLPLGLFSTPVANLSMMDARFSVSPEVFQQCLAFFSRFLLTVRTKTDGGVGMHTVRGDGCVAVGGGPQMWSWKQREACVCARSSSC